MGLLTILIYTALVSNQYEIRIPNSYNYGKIQLIIWILYLGQILSNFDKIDLMIWTKTLATGGPETQ